MAGACHRHLSPRRWGDPWGFDASEPPTSVLGKSADSAAAGVANGFAVQACGEPRTCAGYDRRWQRWRQAKRCTASGIASCLRDHLSTLPRSLTLWGRQKTRCKQLRIVERNRRYSSPIISLPQIEHEPADRRRHGGAVGADMKPLTAAEKRCLLQAVDHPFLQDASTKQAGMVSQALAVLRAVCSSPPEAGAVARRGGGSGRAARVSAAAWADLLVDLIKRARDALDRALAATGDAVSDVLQQVLELSWAHLDALAAVRCGWKADAFLAVRSSKAGQLRLAIRLGGWANLHHSDEASSSSVHCLRFAQAMVVLLLTGGEGALHHCAEAEQG